MGKKDGDSKRKRKRAIFESDSEDDESGEDLEDVGIHCDSFYFV